MKIKYHKPSKSIWVKGRVAGVRYLEEEWIELQLFLNNLNKRFIDKKEILKRIDFNKSMETQNY